MIFKKYRIHPHQTSSCLPKGFDSGLSNLPQIIHSIISLWTCEAQRNLHINPYSPTVLLLLLSSLLLLFTTIIIYSTAFKHQNFLNHFLNNNCGKQNNVLQKVSKS